MARCRQILDHLGSGAGDSFTVKDKEGSHWEMKGNCPGFSSVHFSRWLQLIINEKGLTE